MITPDTIKAEHDAAIAALTPQQLRAIERRDQARRMAAVRGAAGPDHLAEIFTAEAAARSVVS